jgi:hypothetical protein
MIVIFFKYFLKKLKNIFSMETNGNFRKQFRRQIDERILL